MLLHALFFSRWCNRDSTLDSIEAAATFLSGGASTAREVLEHVHNPPWDNVAAYPVGPVLWRGATFQRLEAATALFSDPACLEFLAQVIRESRGSVLEATAAINEVFQMENDFPIFMAVMDVAWFRPDLIDPASEVPVGIGAIPFLRLLGSELGAELSHGQIFARMIALQPTYWPEAKRSLHPVDVEYLCCECRKYYSYVVGTKTFDGKNLFRPGESPLLSFDDVAQLDEPSGPTRAVYVIAGAPGSGKSSIVAALQAAGRRVELETAEQMIRAALAEGRTAAELRSDPVAWQLQLLRSDYELFEGLLGPRPSADGQKAEQCESAVFTDTSFVETAVFSRRAGIALGPKVEAWLRAPQRRYRAVFFLAPLQAYEGTDVRQETQQIAARISEEVRAAYERLGYDLIIVPPLPLDERVQLLLSYVGGNEQQQA